MLPHPTPAGVPSRRPSDSPGGTVPLPQHLEPHRAPPRPSLQNPQVAPVDSLWNSPNIDSSIRRDIATDRKLRQARTCGSRGTSRKPAHVKVDLEVSLLCTSALTRDGLIPGIEIPSRHWDALATCRLEVHALLPELLHLGSAHESPDSEPFSPCGKGALLDDHWQLRGWGGEGVRPQPSKLDDLRETHICGLESYGRLVRTGYPNRRERSRPWYSPCGYSSCLRFLFAI